MPCSVRMVRNKRKSHTRMEQEGDGMKYIVPMKKPICINCPFRSLDSCTLIYLMSDKDSEVTVHVNEMTVSPDCPLIEIPTPHGRLIDGDEMIRIWDGATIEGSIKPLIEARPTVIEAEGREE